jgi:hypothetical protein
MSLDWRRILLAGAAAAAGTCIAVGPFSSPAGDCWMVDRDGFVIVLMMQDGRCLI